MIRLKSLKIASLSALTLLAITATAAQAQPKATYWAWWPSHWENLNFPNPYLENGTHPHNTQWDDKAWAPSDWAAQRPGGGAEVIRGLYVADIFQRQYMDGKMPVLVVGPNFYHLSGEDKRRVTGLVDEYFQITSSKLNGMFVLQDWRTRRQVGLYTAYGLQIQ